MENMDIQKLRIDNLRSLVQKHKSIAAFARNYDGIDASYISMLLNKHRSFGEKSARQIENKIGVKSGWFDIDHSLGTPVQAVDDANPPADAVQIKRVKFSVSAGINGQAIDQEEVMGNPIFFRRDWLTSKGYFADKLVAVDVHGESMEPGLYEGDTVIVNTGDVSPRDGCVFVIRYEDETVVKRLLRDAGKWWLCSDNADQRRFPRKEVVDGLCDIIGRVIHKQSDRI